MTVNTFTIGAYSIDILLDGIFEPTKQLLTHQKGAARLQPIIDGIEGDTLHFQVNCFLVRGNGHTALVDSGAGNHWGPSFGHTRAALKEKGIGLDQIDHVLVTHLHTDHILGLLDGEDAALPNATLLVPRVDLEFFTNAEARAALPAEKQGTFDTVATLVKAYGSRIVTIEAGAVPGFAGITAYPLPGHTPGQVGYQFAGTDKTVLLIADAMHTTPLQVEDPEIGVGFDIDSETAAKTRIALVKDTAAKGWVIAGAHILGFSTISAGADGHLVIAPAAA